MLWNKLPEKDLDIADWRKRVLFFDPTEVPNMFNVKPFQRHQNVSIGHIFPIVEDICACGCGKELTGRRKRWATEECSKFAVAVRFIIYGSFTHIRGFLSDYYKWECSICGCPDKGHNMGANGTVAWIKIDHIIPVKLGGGACWLSNYQLVCHDCHCNKTNSDFGWKKK